jgi:hypothetical protein
LGKSFFGHGELHLASQRSDYRFKRITVARLRDADESGTHDRTAPPEAHIVIEHAMLARVTQPLCWADAPHGRGNRAAAIRNSALLYRYSQKKGRINRPLSVCCQQT